MTRLKRLNKFGRTLHRLLVSVRRVRVGILILVMLVCYLVYLVMFKEKKMFPDSGGHVSDERTCLMSASYSSLNHHADDAVRVDTGAQISSPKVQMTSELPRVNLSNTTADVSKLKYILFWNEYYGFDDFGWGKGQQPFVDANCPVSTCYGTSDKSSMAVDKFDAILFHMQTVTFWPRRRSPHQHYVFVTKEAPAYLYTNLKRFPNFFNLTMTYKLSSDFPIPYGEVRHINRSLSVPINTKNFADGKTKLVAWFVSNCRTSGRRERYVRLLKRFIQVDVYGKCGQLKCSRSANLSCHTNVLDAQYKFYLSFENSICEEYVTEKFFDALRHNVVPVVFGGANYSAIAPPGSYINALDFSPEELAAYLVKLDRDDSLYNSFFEWKQNYEVVTQGFKKKAFCDLCKQLHSSATKTYSNIYEWWSSNKCYKLKI